MMMSWERGFFSYLCLVNVIGFCLMGLDKWKAKKRKWRISERTLFLVGIIGGSLGSWAGMYAFRHKTKHWSFVMGMPLLLIIQVAFTLFLTFKL